MRSFRVLISFLLMVGAMALLFFIYADAIDYHNNKAQGPFVFTLLALLQLFGYALVLLLLALCTIGYKCIRHHTLTIRHTIIGVICIVFASAVLFDIHFTGALVGIQSGGGTLGQLMTNPLSEFASIDMITLICTALLLYGIVLVTRLPILRICEDIGFLALNYRKATALNIIRSYLPFAKKPTLHKTHHTNQHTASETQQPQEEPFYATTNVDADAPSGLFTYTKNEGFGSNEQKEETQQDVQQQTPTNDQQLDDGATATDYLQVDGFDEPNVSPAEPSETKQQLADNTMPPDATNQQDETCPEGQIDARVGATMPPDPDDEQHENIQPTDAQEVTQPQAVSSTLPDATDVTDYKKKTESNAQNNLAVSEDDYALSSASEEFILTSTSKDDLASAQKAHSLATSATRDSFDEPDDINTIDDPSASTQIISVPKSLREAAYKAHQHDASIANDTLKPDSRLEDTSDEIDTTNQDAHHTKDATPPQSAHVDSDKDDAPHQHKAQDDLQDNLDTTSYIVVKENNNLQTADYTDISLIGSIAQTPQITDDTQAVPNISLSPATHTSVYTDDDKSPHIAVHTPAAPNDNTNNTEQPFTYLDEFATDDEDGTYTREVKQAVQALIDDIGAENEPLVTNLHGTDSDSIPIAWQHPTSAILSVTEKTDVAQHASLQQMADALDNKLAEFGIDVEVKEMVMGPTVSLFSILPAPGVKVSRIQALDRDLARALSVKSVRIVDIIPGKPYVGIEVPNKTRTMVRLREMVDLMKEQSAKPLTFALGKDIAGHIITANLMKMPHLLIAGTTGSGKSVGIHTILLSMLCLYTPEQLRLILVDPKMLELSFYRDIPHLCMPVISDMPKAIKAFDWCVGEMERRYQLMAAVNVRNIEALNQQITQAARQPNGADDMLVYLNGEQVLLSSQQIIPYVAVIIDEFADMVMTLGKKAEEAIVRLAQKARASGIHLILATQRPSVDVITGLIKANVPSRLSFMVSSKVDSRTVLDESGAEQLLGHGDMLFMPVGETIPKRVQGAFVSEAEIDAVCDHWRMQQQGARHMIDLSHHDEAGDENLDDLYGEVYALITSNNKVESISALQRRFSIGYNRAARILEQLEAKGVVSPPTQSGKRQLLV